MPPQRLLLALLLPLHAIDVYAATLEILTYENAGVFEADTGKKGRGGPGSAVLGRMQQLSGISLRQHLVPLLRANAMTEQFPNHCSVAVPRTAEREPHFVWAGPWARGATTLYGRTDDTRRVSGPQDLRGSRIVVLRDSAPAQWLRQQQLAAESVKDNTTALRMLNARRADYWLANDIAAHFVIRAEGGLAPKPMYSTGRIDLYIACHRGSDPAAIAALDAAISRMRRSGELTEFGMR